MRDGRSTTGGLTGAREDDGMKADQRRAREEDDVIGIERRGMQPTLNIGLNIWEDNMIGFMRGGSIIGDVRWCI